MQCTHLQPSRAIVSAAEDLRGSLLQPPRSIPCSYLYDSTGSQLFERICETEEYYPTRTETQLLSDACRRIVETCRPAQVLELGSGSSSKIHVLLESCKRQEIECSYMPMDICESAVQDACQVLREKYDWLHIQPVVGNYNAGLANLPQSPGRRLYAFLGGTIGNMGEHELEWFFSELIQAMNPGDWLLLGADRVKEPAVLNAAYNDRSDYTAKFFLNALNVLNDKLGANFDPERFRYEGSYNIDLERVEMYLISEQAQRIYMEELDKEIHLRKDEKILAEVSRKFSFDGLNTMVEARGLEVRHHFEPENRYFSLVLAQYNP